MRDYDRYETASFGFRTRASDDGGIEYSSGGFITSVGGRPSGATLETRRAAQQGVPTGRVLRGFAALYRKAHPFTGDDEGPADADYLLPGCFAESLKRGDCVRFCAMHLRSRDFGSTSDGALKLLETETGLAFELKLSDSDDHAELLREIASDAKRGMSIGYYKIKAARKVVDGTRIRILEHARLDEISLVDRPAIRGTGVAVLDAAKAEPFESAARSFSLAATVASENLSASLRAFRDKVIALA